jgi:hypothetical protein
MYGKRSKVYSRVIISMLLITFLFGVYETFSLQLSWILEGETISLWSAIKLHFHWWYWFESFGLIYSLGNLLYYLPFLMVAILFAWLDRRKKEPLK